MNTSAILSILSATTDFISAVYYAIERPKDNESKND